MPIKLNLGNRWLVRYSAAVAAAGVGLLLRLGLTSLVGEGLPTYITFYPPVMLAALLGEFGPGLVATAKAALLTDYWLLPPAGFGIERPVDAIGLAFFCGMGLFMSTIAELSRRYRHKAAAYDREAALRESRARLAAFAEATFEGIVDSEAGRIVDCNEQFARMLGYSVAELRGMEIPALIASEDRDRVIASIREGRESVIEHALLRRDGTRIVVETHGRPVSPGNARRHTAVRDITERKQAEEVVHRLNAELRARVTELQAANEALHTSRKAARNLMEDALQARKQTEETSAKLRASSEQRRLALEAADLGAWDYHFQSGDVTWDECCREMWGIPESDHVDYSAAINRIHPDDRAGVDAAVQEALSGRGGGGYHREFRVVWPDGSVRWIASHGHVYFQGEGDQRRPIRFIGANHEITAEKAAREALWESEERLAAFAATTFEGIILSEGGRIVDCNEQFAQMLGTTTQEVIGSTIEQHTAPEDRQRVMENIRAGRESVTEHQLLRRDGSRITVEAHGHSSDASRSGLRHTAIRDITERKQREEQLEKLNRTLTALKDSSQAMLRAASEADYLDEVCKIIVQDCGHAMVWVGFAQDDEGKTVRPAAHAGFEEGYLQTLNITWADIEHGPGPTGTAIRTGKACACANMLTDPRFAP